VTVEEALVALLAAVAGILLFLGLAQALDDLPPDRRRSRYHLPEGSRRSGLGAPSGSLRLASRYSASDLPPAG
jgi:hypothetical protein